MTPHPMSLVEFGAGAAQAAAPRGGDGVVALRVDKWLCFFFEDGGAPGQARAQAFTREYEARVRDGLLRQRKAFFCIAFVVSIVSLALKSWVGARARAAAARCCWCVDICGCG